MYKLRKAYINNPKPYTAALWTLRDKYGEPKQFVHREMDTIMSMAQVKDEDMEACEDLPSQCTPS